MAIVIVERDIDLTTRPDSVEKRLSGMLELAGKCTPRVDVGNYANLVGRASEYPFNIHQAAQIVTLLSQGGGLFVYPSHFTRPADRCYRADLIAPGKVSGFKQMLGFSPIPLSLYFDFDSRRLRGMSLPDDPEIGSQCLVEYKESGLVVASVVPLAGISSGLHVQYVNGTLSEIDRFETVSGVAMTGTKVTVSPNLGHTLEYYQRRGREISGSQPGTFGIREMVTVDQQNPYASRAYFSVLEERAIIDQRTYEEYRGRSEHALGMSHYMTAPIRLELNRWLQHGMTMDEVAVAVPSVDDLWNFAFMLGILLPSHEQEAYSKDITLADVAYEGLE